MRGAYADYLPRDRHPLLALFVTLDAREVDVNVHPAKAEVRFRNAGLVRGADRACAQDRRWPREGSARGDDRRRGDHRGVPAAARLGLAAFAGAAERSRGGPHLFRPRERGAWGGGCAAAVLPRRRRPRSTSAAPAADLRDEAADADAAAFAPDADRLDHPLGAARAQVHETYIVAQTRDGLVIVDQHAAHERIVYERLKAAIDKTGVARQILLIPEIVELDEADVERLVARADELGSLRPGARSLRPRRGGAARNAVAAGRDRRRRAGARPRRAYGANGTRPCRSSAA